jgi:hypothetical protein
MNGFPGSVRIVEKVINFVLLDETGPNDILLFMCRQCPDTKMTSHQIEQHMRVIHGARKLSVHASPITTVRKQERTR